MTYKIDFHSHTGHSADSLTPARTLLDAARRRGIAALAVTDHNTVDGALQAQALVANDPERYGNLIILPGEEVKTSEGELIGLFLRTTTPRGRSPEETIGHIREQGGLVLVPHPFDRLRGSRIRPDALERVAGLVDGIEVFNARTTFAADNRRAVAFAQRHHLPMVAGSDAHVAREVGYGYVEIDEPPATTPQKLLAQLRVGRIGGRSSVPLVHFGSTLAKWRKRLGFAPAVQL